MKFECCFPDDRDLHHSSNRFYHQTDADVEADLVAGLLGRHRGTVDHNRGLKVERPGHVDPRAEFSGNRAAIAVIFQQLRGNPQRRDFFDFITKNNFGA